MGKVENNYKRYGVRNVHAFANGIAPYLTLHSNNITGLVHPTHRDEEQKRERANLLARKRRAASKLAAG